MTFAVTLHRVREGKAAVDSISPQIFEAGDAEVVHRGKRATGRYQGSLCEVDYGQL
jgi:hypothetical protein